MILKTKNKESKIDNTQEKKNLENNQWQMDIEEFENNGCLINGD